MNTLRRVAFGVLLFVSFCQSFYFGYNGLEYGKHKPDGTNLVSYMTGPYGPWKSIGQLEYVWNYYENYATINHPFNKSQLIAYANPRNNRNTTARDANGHLLWDFDHDLEIDESEDYGSAFCEHYGTRWIGDVVNTNGAFTNFWYDDNNLASFMTQAYGVASPSGLSTYSDFTRWSIIGGDWTKWTPYQANTNYFDQLALNGLYYLAKGDTASAIKAWNKIISLAAPSYDGDSQQYNYPAFGAPDMYYLGLVKMFTDLLAIRTSDVSGTLTQHSVSLRSALINAINSKSQQGTSLINTETMSTWALGLGAGAYESYEFGADALQYPSDHNLYLRPYHALSAIVTQDNSASKKGYLCYGPYSTYPVGDYAVDFFLRAHEPKDGTNMVTIEIHDATTDQIFGQRDLSTGFIHDTWVIFSTNFTVTDKTHTYEFRSFWHGVCNIDLAFIRVRSLKPAVLTPPLTSSAETFTTNAVSISTTDRVTSGSPMSTSRLTTSRITSGRITSGSPITSSQITTSRLTTASLSTSRLTASRITTGTIVGNTCSVDREQICLSNNTYTTCTNGKYSTPQTCRSGLVCTSAGGNIYCVPYQDSSSSSSGSVVGQACSKDREQKCLSSSTYSTCTNGRFSIPQSCRSGTVCTPGSDPTTIYCI